MPPLRKMKRTQRKTISQTVTQAAVTVMIVGQGVVTIKAILQMTLKTQVVKSKIYLHFW